MWLFLTSLAWALTGIPSLVLAQGEPPVVDLGTSVHQASLNVRDPPDECDRLQPGLTADSLCAGDWRLLQLLQYPLRRASSRSAPIPAAQA